MNVEICEDWQLRRTDEVNWQLYQLREKRATHSSLKKGTAGEVDWLPTGRYYQWSTVPAALRYVADYKLRNGDPEAATGIGEYIKRLDGMLERFKVAFERAVSAESAR